MKTLEGFWKMDERQTIEPNLTLQTARFRGGGPLHIAAICPDCLDRCALSSQSVGAISKRARGDLSRVRPITYFVALSPHGR